MHRDLSHCCCCCGALSDNCDSYHQFQFVAFLMARSYFTLKRWIICIIHILILCCYYKPPPSFSTTCILIHIHLHTHSLSSDEICACCLQPHKLEDADSDIKDYIKRFLVVIFLGSFSSHGNEPQSFSSPSLPGPPSVWQHEPLTCPPNRSKKKKTITNRKEE